jgi:hypothetical protein
MKPLIVMITFGKVKQNIINNLPHFNKMMSLYYFLAHPLFINPDIGRPHVG